MRPAGRLALLLGVVVLLASMLTTATWAAAQEQPAKAPSAEAEIIDFDFNWRDPGNGQVPAGTTVTFTNRGNRPHTVTDRAGTFDELVMPGQSVSLALTIPGKVSFFCKIRAAAAGSPKGMDGTIDVRATRRAMVNRIQAVDRARFGAQRHFDPPRMTVEAGATVQLANVGGEPHSLTADDGSFDTGVVAPGPEGGRFAGRNATITLLDPGTFPFHCAVHKEMRGVITVKGPSAQDLASVDSTQPPPQAQLTPTTVVTSEQGDSLVPDGLWTRVLAGAAGLLLVLAGVLMLRNRRRPSPRYRDPL